MMDDVFFALEKKAKDRVGLVHKVEVAMNENEYAMILQKAESLNMSIGDLLREYLLNSTAFIDPKDVKRSAPKRSARPSAKKSSN